MKIIFFDTETNGLPKNYNAPHTDTDNFPFLVQIAWVVCDADGEELKSEVFIIKPEGFTIPPNMIHGISHEKALNEGVDLETVLKKFAADLDEATVVVAHNMNFDSKIVGAECVRKGIPYKLFEKELICTMQTTTEFCAIRNYYGFKWATLKELHQKLFGQDFEGAHDAKADFETYEKIKKVFQLYETPEACIISILKI